MVCFGCLAILALVESVPTHMNQAGDFSRWYLSGACGGCRLKRSWRKEAAVPELLKKRFRVASLKFTAYLSGIAIQVTAADVGFSSHAYSRLFKHGEATFPKTSIKRLIAAVYVLCT